MAPSRAPNDPRRVATVMLSWHSLALVSCTTLQTLWAGYGHICAITARATTDAAAHRLDKLCGAQGGAAGTTYPLILKLISPPDAGDEGHLRKMLSYDVEQYFYSAVAPSLLDDDVAVAGCLATTRDMSGCRDGEEELRGLTATIMTDLRPKFPVAGEKRAVLDAKQVLGALEWLGKFHGRSWRWLPDSLDAYVLPPLDESRRRKSSDGRAGGTKLWLNGGYTYLATRRKEYAALAEDADSEWSMPLCQPPRGSLLSVAEMAAAFLTPSGRPFETYIHGDVKSENLFTTPGGDKVAFFDFQYVGLGLGVCDLAKLFTCSVPLEMLVDDADGPLPEELTMCQGEMQLLERYRQHLLAEDGSKVYGWDAFQRHWDTALVDWCRFQASWGFWGNTEWLEARVRSILNDEEWKDWLQQSISDRSD